MKNIIYIISITLIMCVTTAGIVRGEACFRIFEDSSSQFAVTDYYYADLNYNNRVDSFDAMMTKSYVHIGPNYLLDIYNNCDNDAVDVKFVISVNDISMLTSLTIEGIVYGPDDFSEGIVACPCGEGLAPHGIFPVHNMEYAIGSIPSLGMSQLNISVDGTVGLKLHYDACGELDIASEDSDEDEDDEGGDECIPASQDFDQDFTNIYYDHDIPFNKQPDDEDLDEDEDEDEDLDPDMGAPFPSNYPYYMMVQDWEGMPPSMSVAYPGGITPYNPVIDGAFTSPLEWLYASVRTNRTNSGSIYKQNQLNWVATSVASASQTMYSGITLFELHNFWTATTLELADYNIFSYPIGNHRVTAWVFMAGDEPDDTFWLANAQTLNLSHLIPEGTGTNMIIDEGFIVRLDNDPTTDQHWFPAMAEPGDPGWNWLSYYGFFGRGGFNDSGWVQNVYCTAPGEHEVYEVAIHPPFALPSPVPTPPPSSTPVTGTNTPTPTGTWFSPTPTMTPTPTPYSVTMTPTASPTLGRCWKTIWVPVYIGDPHMGRVSHYVPVHIFIGIAHIDKPKNPTPAPPPWPPTPAPDPFPWPDPDPYDGVPNVPVWIRVEGDRIAEEEETLILEVFGGSVPPPPYLPEDFPVRMLATFDLDSGAIFTDLGDGHGIFEFTPPLGTAGGVLEVKFKAVNPIFQNGKHIKIPIKPGKTPTP